jgi:hypothetical protein
MPLLHPAPEQAQLPLLGIEAQQRAHNFFLHGQLVFRITGIELPLFTQAG